MRGRPARSRTGDVGRSRAAIPIPADRCRSRASRVEIPQEQRARSASLPSFGYRHRYAQCRPHLGCYPARRKPNAHRLRIAAMRTTRTGLLRLPTETRVHQYATRRTGTDRSAPDGTFGGAPSETDRAWPALLSSVRRRHCGSLLRGILSLVRSRLVSMSMRPARIGLTRSFARTTKPKRLRSVNARPWFAWSTARCD